MSIPNEEKPRLIRRGMYAGAADLLIIHLTKVIKEYRAKESPIWTKNRQGIDMRVIFVETKTEGGRQSHKQQKFEEHIKSMYGQVEYHICRSLHKFQKIIQNNDTSKN